MFSKTYEVNLIIVLKNKFLFSRAKKEAIKKIVCLFFVFKNRKYDILDNIF